MPGLFVVVHLLFSINLLYRLCRFNDEFNDVANCRKHQDKSIGATSFQGGFTHKFAEHYESDLIIAVSVCCGKENDPLPLREEVVHQVRILC